MSIVVSSPLTLTAADEIALSLDHPIVGWDSIVTINNLTASTADANYPATNLANVATHLKWKAGAAASPPDTFIYLTASFTARMMDYVAIARHNLASIACPISIGYFDTSSPPVYVALINDTTLIEDGPALFRFTAQSLTSIAIRMRTFDSSSPPVFFTPEIAVMYAGKLLVLPRKIYQGLVPITYGRIAKVTNGRSEAGQFLGRIVTQQFVKDTIPLSLIDPTYFRAHIADFLVDSKERPFFFAWRPTLYPAEVDYCHMTNDPAPVNEAPHGLIAMSLEMTGIV